MHLHTPVWKWVRQGHGLSERKSFQPEPLMHTPGLPGLRNRNATRNKFMNRTCSGTIENGYHSGYNRMDGVLHSTYFIIARHHGGQQLQTGKGKERERIKRNTIRGTSLKGLTLLLLLFPLCSFLQAVLCCSAQMPPASYPSR